MDEAKGNGERESMGIEKELKGEADNIRREAKKTEYTSV